MDDPDSIFSCYKKLVQLRKDYPVFVDGKFTLLLEDDENILHTAERMKKNHDCCVQFL